MKTMRKIGSLFLAVGLAVGLCACGGEERETQIGNGVPGKVETIDWTQYDELVEKAKYEIDNNMRNIYLHEAEDMLMDTGAVCPLFSANWGFLKRQEVKGLYMDKEHNYHINEVEVKGSDTLRMQALVEPESLDYTLFSSSGAYQMGLFISEGLFKVNAKQQVDYGCIEKYSVSEDGKMYTFLMRKGMKWSDGSKLDADDFEYSWKRAASPETASQYQDMFSCIEGYPDNLQVKSKNDGRTFVVKLRKPCGFFDQLCTMPVFYPVHQKSIEKAAKTSNDPKAWAAEAGIVCNGAFTIDQWKHNNTIVLKKNPNYYDAEKVKVKRVDLMLTNDSAVAYSAYKDGNLDLVGDLPNDEMGEIKKSKDFTIQEGLSTAMLQMNVYAKVFEGLTKYEACTLRKAFARIIDRKFIVGVALDSGVPATKVIPHTTTDLEGKRFEENTNTYRYQDAESKGYFSWDTNIFEAREMMKSIGYQFDADGKLTTNMVIEYLYNSNTINNSIAECLQQDFAKLGITLRLATRDYNVFLQDAKSGDFEFGRSTWNLDYDDPISILETFKSETDANYTRLGKARE